MVTGRMVVGGRHFVVLNPTSNIKNMPIYIKKKTLILGVKNMRVIGLSLKII